MPKVYSTSPLLEIACFDVESCVQAQQAGADRIEFCADYAAGGVTPSYADIQQVRKHVRTPLHVMIRPRGGGFVYTASEIERMYQDILFCKQQGVDGVVLGALTKEHQIDRKVVNECLSLADPLSVTFHRAIDVCAEPKAALRTLIDLRVHRVLTSGGKPTALEGADTLKYMQQLFGRQIIIMPGGGIRASNLAPLLQWTQCPEFHSAARANGVLQTNEVKDLKEILIG